MSSRKDVGSGCDGLKSELENGRSHRETLIRTCLSQTETFISHFAEEFKKETPGYTKRKLNFLNNDRNFLISEQKTEANTRSRVDKIFDEKCNKF